jgi:succinyl-CoA synthetase beta subunit
MIAVVTRAGRAEIDQRVRLLVQSPAVERALIDWLSGIQRSPELSAAIATAIGQVAQSPEFSRTIEEVYFAGRTARCSARPAFRSLLA